MNTFISIAIDGPSGSGKSTIAKIVSKKLGYTYIDTGAMFRAIALYMLEEGISPEDVESVTKQLNKIQIELQYKNGVQHIFLNGRDVSDLIRKEEVGNGASAVGKIPAVRSHLLLLQRNLAKKQNIIMDGRDIGSVVLPNADLKIYLTASVKVRATRRYKELVERGTDCVYSQIEEEIRARDAQDMNRDIAPLKQCEDAVLLDSSDMTLEEVVKRIIALIDEVESQIGYTKEKEDGQVTKSTRQVILARSAGFCFGVERAVQKVYQESDKNKQVYTLGPIIHNEEVVRDFQKRGVQVISNEHNLVKDGTLIIRSHGVTKEVLDTCKSGKMEVIDATCPFVTKIHKIVKRESEEGRIVIIVGNPTHPEVVGIKGWGNNDTFAVNSYEDFIKLDLDYARSISIVAQTTYNYNKFQEIVDKIIELGYDIKCFNTICNATQERQAEAKELAAKVEVMIVIGDKSSSNTQKLVEICQKECEKTIFIQTIGDLNPDDLISVKSVGITAGASTPNHIIEEVYSNVRS